jgi:hypothetical protein
MNASPGVLAVNLLSVGVNNKYVKSSCSHFVMDTVENWQGVPSTFSSKSHCWNVWVFCASVCVTCRYTVTFFLSYLGLADLRQWIYQITLNFHQALLYWIVFRISIMWVFKVALWHFVCEYITFLVGVTPPRLHA